MPIKAPEVIHTRAKVNISFPELPKVPKLTIAADAHAMDLYQKQLDTWYFSLRQAVRVELESMAAEINSLKTK